MELTCIPKAFRELQRFYGDVFSPLYDRFMTSGAVAQELHAEMAAGLDHLFCKTSETVIRARRASVRQIVIRIILWTATLAAGVFAQTLWSWVRAN